MALTNIYKFRSTGNKWRGKLIECTNPENPIPVDLTTADKVYVVFVKPDGTQIPTDDQIRDGFEQGAFLETPSIPTDSFIVFLDQSTPSILDLKGNWGFSVAAKIDDVIIKSPIATLFWVI